MAQQTRFGEGDLVEWDTQDGKTIVAEVTDAYSTIKGSALSGDRREVMTYNCEILSDDVYDNEMIVDEETDSLRAHDN